MDNKKYNLFHDKFIIFTYINHPLLIILLPNNNDERINKGYTKCEFGFFIKSFNPTK